MHAAWWMLGALAVLAIAYRYYSAFIAAKVLGTVSKPSILPIALHNDMEVGIYETTRAHG